MSIQHVSLRQLKVFEAAATNRSFSKAAKILHLTQPGVSMHIKELETNAGLPLFERVGKRLFVTEAGQELLSRAREILRSLKDAEDALDGLKGLKRGRINLAVVSTAKYFVPQLLARFGKVDLELHTGRLAVLDVIGTPVMRQWHVAHLAKKRLSPTAIAFKQFVLTEGRELMRTPKT